MTTPQAKAEAPDERAAVEALARDYRGVLLRYFNRRSIVAADLEDAVQEVFARLLRRTGEVPIETPDGYLFQIAASVAVDFHRRAVARSRAAHVPYDDDLHAVADFSPERIHAGREEVALVMAALLELPERTRNAFLLTRFERMRLTDVAKRLNLSVAGVEKNVRKAVMHVLLRLEDAE